MLLEPTLFLDGINLVTGPGSGCGKTTFAKAMILAIHRAGHSVATVSVGMEGMTGLRRGCAADRACGSCGGTADAGLKDSVGGLPIAARGRISAVAGDVFVTPEAYLASDLCEPEILDLVPGASAVGRLAIARARRDGDIVLAGPEDNEHLAWIVRRILEEGWAKTIIVDGSINRITQAAALPNACLFYAVRAERSNYAGMSRAMKYFLHLSDIPRHSDTGAGQPKRDDEKICRVPGPLTQYFMDTMPPGVETIVVRDFSKVFLDESEFLRAERKYRIEVAEKLRFGGFAVSLKGVRKDEFAQVIGTDVNGRVISFDVCDGGQ